jgi:hypothetical protein
MSARSEPLPRANIVAGRPVGRRVTALDALLRPWFPHGPHRVMGGIPVVIELDRPEGR